MSETNQSDYPRKTQSVYGRVTQVWTYSHFECDECGYQGDSCKEVIYGCDCPDTPDRDISGT